MNYSLYINPHLYQLYLHLYGFPFFFFSIQVPVKPSICKWHRCPGYQIYSKFERHQRQRHTYILSVSVQGKYRHRCTLLKRVLFNSGFWKYLILCIRREEEEEKRKLEFQSRTNCRVKKRAISCIPSLKLQTSSLFTYVHITTRS